MDTIICLSEEHETYWSLQKAQARELASVPLKDMAEFVRKHGRPCPIKSSEEADVMIGPAELTGKIEEEELRTELSAS